MPGQYTFAFSNMKDKVNAKEVTIAIHPGYEESRSPKKDDEITKEFKELAESSGVKMGELKKMEELITSMTQNIETLKGSQKLSMNRLRNRNEAVNYNF